ncbi:60S ribosomal protein L28, putative [Theileria equi strain WA]|uniref:60S ribosomal protein L28, putative n=1 Tax=Theileria equi strain WA TaxID=1537102 RepID=L1LD83_THEEQ|nr:60S ribosomal protein L28, putative [Theileria equi strain WA]EKX73286.1 60S ribosomal protein L28, putative [Theileria equi strain WA]|eukprot:XP_004832738.1 60S ribosomal protein L28, putative [Theileria equi strain WA]
MVGTGQEFQVSCHAPDCLVWEITRKSHAFLKKSGFTEFSLEPFNLVGKNTPKYTGFSHKPVLDIVLTSNGSLAIQKTRKLLETRSPANNKSAKKVAKCLKNLPSLRKTVREHRPDLAKDFLLKFVKLVHAKTDDKSE